MHMLQNQIATVFLSLQRIALSGKAMEFLANTWI